MYLKKKTITKKYHYMQWKTKYASRLLLFSGQNSDLITPYHITRIHGVRLSPPPHLFSPSPYPSPPLSLPLPFGTLNVLVLQ